MRPADRLGTRLGEAEVLHLALLDQLLHRAGDLFDRHRGIDPVLVVEIDAVGPQPLQRRLDHFADVCRLAVKAAAGLHVESELGCDDDLVPERSKRLTDEIFIGERSVHLGRVKERDAPLVGGTDDPDSVVPVCGRSVVGADTHAPEAEFRDLECAKFSRLHPVLRWSAFGDRVPPGLMITAFNKMMVRQAAIRPVSRSSRTLA
jgi:hypothetical protein